MAVTNTYTTTRTRIDLIQVQIRIALRQTANPSTYALNAIEKGIENQWISKVNVYAFDSGKLCRGQLIFEIDWDAHNSFVSSGKAKISLDSRYWTEDQNLAVEVEAAVRLFNKFVDRNRFDAKWSVNYSPSVNEDYVDRELGFQTADPINWATDNRSSSNYTLQELSEFQVGIYLSD